MNGAEAGGKELSQIGRMHSVYVLCAQEKKRTGELFACTLDLNTVLPKTHGVR